MELCPILKSDCTTQCALFREDECAFAKLHDIVDNLDYVQDALNALQETIDKKDFSQ